MTSEEAIKTAKAYDEFFKRGTEIKKPSQSIKIMKDGKTISNPPKQDSHIHRKKTKSITVDISKFDCKLATSCIICGESVELDAFEERSPYVFKVCPACKEAIIVMKKNLGI